MMFRVALLETQTPNMMWDQAAINFAMIAMELGKAMTCCARRFETFGFSLYTPSGDRSRFSRERQRLGYSKSTSSCISPHRPDVGGHDSASLTDFAPSCDSAACRAGEVNYVIR
jgi:hypothetical protein